VDYHATVWVNGVQVASHEGGHTPFSADVTYTLSGKAARYAKPIFWTETIVPGTVEDRLRWLKDPLELVQRLRSGGLPLVGYTWWPLFSLLDWAYREGVRPPEAYLWHMGMYDLEPDGRGTFLRTETPVVGAFRTATERISER
jgi:beta-glucosidase